MTVSTLSSSSGATESSNNYHPFVRYGDSTGTQKPVLHRITDPIPDDAITVSPVYQLDSDQLAQHKERRENPYTFDGDANLAKILQDECEAKGQVLYPVYVESDANVAFSRMIDSMTGFIEDELEVPVSSCTWYYSGGRSIHAHLPEFVAGEEGLNHLRKIAIEFNKDSSVSIDPQIYTRKRQFRIPGVIHDSSGGRKANIDPDWSHQRILRAADDADQSAVPKSYTNLISETVAEGSEIANWITSRRGREEWELSRTAPEPNPTVETPLIEQDEYPAGESVQMQNRWRKYNIHEYSPYAKTSGNGRSVAAFQVKGSAFAKSDVQDGATLIPAHFYGAIGGDGSFILEDDFVPLQLSKPDYRKRDWEKLIGASLVLIGGGNGRSLIHRVEQDTAVKVAERLSVEIDGRQAALELLENEGFDTGSSGPPEGVSHSRGRRTSGSARDMREVLPATDPRSEAGEHQQRAEEIGIEALSHDERFKVAARLLQKYRWQPVWDWFKERFGDSFKPQVTWDQLQSVVNQYPEDYEHITIPSAPSN